MKKIFASVILILAATTILRAQQNVEFTKANFGDNKEGLKTALSQLKEGDKLYEMGGGMFRQALDFYLPANSFNPNNAMLNYKIGKCYLKSIQKTQSISYFEKALKLNPYVAPDIHFLLGQAYHLNMEFDKAITSYKAYLGVLAPNDIATKTPIVNKKIDECNFAKELVKKKARVFIDPLSNTVNTMFSEYSPVISADETVMMFTSRREGTTGGDRDPQDNEFFEDIYITTKTNGIWSVPVNPGKPMNSDNHDATVALSNDGSQLIIYKGDNGGDLFLCKQNGAEWSKPERLPKTINTEFHESGASFSFDGRTLYFVSDKPGGFGGRDIYMSRKDEKGRWGAAINLGPMINTAYDEEGIFAHPDGKTIYFSSCGHKTMGGYDIFKSVFENGVWSEPENIGYPINTPGDDVGLVISASGRHGYYFSEKEKGIGLRDLYMITFLGPEKPLIANNEDNLIASAAEPVSETVIEAKVEVKMASLTILKGKIYDAFTNDPVFATIELTDNVKNEVIATFESNSTTGKYLVSLPSGKNYGIAVKKEGYLFHSENFEIPATASYQEIIKDIGLKKVEVGSKIVLKNIFFDFGKATLRPESFAELDRLAKLLEEFKTMRIEISGHTDNKGSDDLNNKLSTNRAKAVVDYLVQYKEIDGSRLEFKGYGKSQPIAPNDTDANRQLNRRTEFKVLSK